MKATLAGMLLIAVVVIAFMHERIKELKVELANRAPKPQSIPPFDVERMAAAQLHWSEQMTRVDRAEGRDNWRYQFAEAKFAEATATLIRNVNVDLDNGLVTEANEILDQLENR